MTTPKEALKALVRRLANAAFNAGHENAGDAWTRQEKTAALMDRLLDEVLSALDQAGGSKPAEGWQPIETVPGNVRNGVIVASDGYVEEAWFDGERGEWYPANTDYTDAHSAAIYPTHWMPLPPPPAAPKEPQP